MLTGYTIETLTPDLKAELVELLGGGPDAKVRETHSLVGAVWGTAVTVPCGNSIGCHARWTIRVVRKDDTRALQVRFATGYDMTPDTEDGRVAIESADSDLLVTASAAMSKLASDLATLSLAVAVARQRLAAVASKHALIIDQGAP